MMMGKLSKAVLMSVVLILVVSSVAYAEEESHVERIRYFGEITDINPESNNFTLHTFQAE